MSDPVDDSAPGLVAVGVSHRGGDAAAREALFVPDSDMPSFLDALRRAGLTQALVLSTCDRTEVQAAHADPSAAAAAIASVLAARAPGAAAAIYRRLGADATVNACASASAPRRR